MTRLSSSAGQPRPGRPGATRWAWRAVTAWLMCAANAAPPAQAGRTDIDWLAPAQHAMQIDAPVDLERLDIAQPAAAVPVGSAATPAAIVADMRIATHAEARALLQGGSLPGGADAGGGTATLAALLDRLGMSMPSSADRPSQRPESAGAGLDCALFVHGVRMRRLLGTGDPHKPGESAGPVSAMGLDVPIRCLATVPRIAVPAPDGKPSQPASDQASEESGPQLRPVVEAWARANSMGLAALAGSVLALAGLGLVASARVRGWACARVKNTMKGGASNKAREHRKR